MRRERDLPPSGHLASHPFLNNNAEGEGFTPFGAPCFSSLFKITMRRERDLPPSGHLASHPFLK